jgi:hypothetical protein
MPLDIFSRVNPSYATPAQYLKNSVSSLAAANKLSAFQGQLICRILQFDSLDVSGNIVSTTKRSPGVAEAVMPWSVPVTMQ